MQHSKASEENPSEGMDRPRAMLALGIVRLRHLGSPRGQEPLDRHPGRPAELIDALSVPEQQAPRSRLADRSHLEFQVSRSGIGNGKHDQNDEARRSRAFHRRRKRSDRRAAFPLSCLPPVAVGHRLPLRGLRSPILVTRKSIKAFIIGFSAIQLVDSGSRLVSTFLEHPMFIAKLNESHHRSEILPGPTIQSFAPSIRLIILVARKAAWFLFSTEMTAPQSPLLTCWSAKRPIGNGSMTSASDAPVEERVEAILVAKSSFYQMSG